MPVCRHATRRGPSSGRPIRGPLLSSLLAAALASPLGAQPIDSASVAGMRWRTVGPANFMGRLSDVVGIPSPSKTVFVAAAAGGIWKSANNGITWRPVFDDKRVISMGMLAIAPSDTQQVWAGTGEPNSRNSIEPGGGIFKSTDGGLTWKPMGLEKTEHIGRIVVHPTNPDVVYVAALGAAWRSNPERGLYRTKDGGTSWQLVKFVSDKAGFVDVAIHPTNPNVLFATSWERRRTPYSLFSGGPGSALWKSTDGGDSWTEVTGGGFPSGYKGRMSLDINRANPNVMYMMIEAAENGTGPIVGERSPKRNGLWKSTDGGATWAQMNNINVRPFYYSQVRSDPKNPDRVYFSSTELQLSEDGGKTSRNAAQNVHVDDHGIWIDPNDPQRWFLANDGGIAITYDAGGNFLQPQNLPIGQFYEVAFDMAVPYNICGGAQDNGSWCGPSRRRQGPITNSMWYTYNGGDGFVTALDPTDPDIIYGESQGGNIGRYQVSTGQRTALQKPNYRPQYMAWEDSIMTVRGDTTVPATAAQTRLIAELRAKQKADSAALQIRWNWNTPFFISAHSHKTLYFGSNRVMKSTKRGDDMYPISPDLSYADTTKIRISTRTTGGITTDATGAETFGTIVSLNESTLRPGHLYAGTDDGRFRVSRDGGATWRDAEARFPGLPKGSWFAGVEPSRHDSGTVFVVVDNHRSNDFTNYVYRSTDFGATWTRLEGDLPANRVARTIRQDPRNPQLLYLATEFGLFLSPNGGTNWVALRGNMPLMPFNDLVIHPRDNALVLASHARGVWVYDQLNALQELTPAVAGKPAHLFTLQPAHQLRTVNVRPHAGDMIFRGENPAVGALVDYWLGDAGSTVTLTVHDSTGRLVQTLTPATQRGLNRVVWNLRHADLPLRSGGGEDDDEGPRPTTPGPLVMPGSYTVRLVAGATRLEQKVLVREDPRLTVTRAERAAWTAFHREIAQLVERFVPVAERIRALTGTDEATKDRKRQAQELQSRIATLYGAVGRWTGVPTADQRTQLAYYQRMARTLETP